MRVSVSSFTDVQSISSTAFYSSPFEFGFFCYVNRNKATHCQTRSNIKRRYAVKRNETEKEWTRFRWLAIECYSSVMLWCVFLLAMRYSAATIYKITCNSRCDTYFCFCYIKTLALTLPDVVAYCLIIHQIYRKRVDNFHILCGIAIQYTTSA